MREIVTRTGAVVVLCESCELRSLSVRLGRWLEHDEREVRRRQEPLEVTRPRRKATCGRWHRVPDGAGVYVFRFPCGGVYVGSSWRLRMRIISQLRQLETSRHLNQFVQAAWDECGGGIGMSCTYRELPQVKEPEELCWFENRLMDYWSEERRALLLNIERPATPYQPGGRAWPWRRPVGPDGRLLQQNCSSTGEAASA